ncbi:hypothetical protein JHK82_038416 [Glycine max]|uniref:Uncharacterized protein n=1 Tax=Glycine max TaxID=3847 RepID=A0A0R0GIA7_SOYBN|nr:hypothetical protein JHK86_038598 [Glycine max]KAG4964193.1 hypothetical protein JHK85_039168 [Glycine max]KAG5109193.1 hypothetical protein JHK82_038416 [Glycine max]KAG5120478.1 hypothetical protein JHK84_038818 [Glycine max]
MHEEKLLSGSSSSVFVTFPSFNIFCRNGTLNIHNNLVAILHNGRQCIFDTTELQARMIIWLASKEMEENTTGLHSEALLIHVSRGLSIKKSLENFLQRRRKKRSLVTQNDMTKI